MVATAVREERDVSTVRYHPRGASVELFGCRERVVIVSGPAGTGKTYGALWRLHACALKYPGMRGIMLRKVQEDLTASALVTYQERVLGSGRFGVRTYGGSKMTPAAFQYPNGSMLMVGGLDKSEKVMSREYDLVYVNEMWELTEEDVDNLTTRIRWGVMPYQQVFGDTNPQGPGHHLYKRTQAGKARMLFSVHQDNPDLYDESTGQWTVRGQAYLDGLNDLTGFRRDRLLLGLWTAAEGVVYPEFNRQTHVKTVNCEGWSTVLGMDVGTRNPTALLTIRHAGDRIHLEREHYQRGMSSDDMVDIAVARYNETKATHMVLDPSAASLIVSLQRRGVNVRKGVNDIVVGIGRVSSALSTFTIDPSCIETINEFESYQYPDGRRSGVDTPVKDNDHAMDALRYVVMDLVTAPSGSLVAN